MEHTKGPWEVDSLAELVSSTANYTVICEMWYGGRASSSEIKANANLISAAPDMYKALNEIIQLNRRTAHDKYGDEEKAESWACVKVARKALDKAEGKS